MNQTKTLNIHFVTFGKKDGCMQKVDEVLHQKEDDIQHFLYVSLSSETCLEKTLACDTHIIWTLHLSQDAATIMEFKNLRILHLPDGHNPFHLPHRSKKKSVLVYPRQYNDDIMQHIPSPQTFTIPYDHDASGGKVFFFDVLKGEDTYEQGLPNAFSDIPSLRFLNTPQHWNAFVKKTSEGEYDNHPEWKEWILDPRCLIDHLKENLQGYHFLDLSTGERIDGFNDKLDEMQCPDFSDHCAYMNMAKHIELLQMTWSYILCFEDNCSFDFRALANEVYCIGAKNGYGKTSFLQIICLALFGIEFPSRTSSENAERSYVCEKKPDGQDACTRITFSLNGSEYSIERSFMHPVICLYEAETVKSSDDTYIKDWITSHIGTVESFLTSCVITQTSDQDFFARSNGSQKQFIFRALKLHDISYLDRFFEQVQLQLQAFHEKIKDKCIEKEKECLLHYTDVTPEKHTQMESEITFMKNSLKQMEADFHVHQDNFQCKLHLIHSLQQYAYSHENEHLFKKELHDVLKEKYEKLGIVLKKMGSQKWDVSLLLEEIGALKMQLKQVQDEFDTIDKDKYDKDYFEQKRKCHNEDAANHDTHFLLNMDKAALEGEWQRLSSLTKDEKWQQCIDDIQSSIHALMEKKGAIETVLNHILTSSNEHPIYSKEQYDAWQYRFDALNSKYNGNVKTILPQKLEDLKYEQGLLRKPFFKNKAELKAAEKRLEDWITLHITSNELSVGDLDRAHIPIEDEIMDLTQRCVNVQMYIDSELVPEYEQSRKLFENMLLKKPPQEHCHDAYRFEKNEEVITEAEMLTDAQTKLIQDYIDKVPILKMAVELQRQQLRDKQDDIQWISRFISTTKSDSKSLYDKMTTWRNQEVELKTKVHNMNQIVHNKDRYEMKKRVLEYYFSKKYHEWMATQEENSRNMQRIKQKIDKQEALIKDQNMTIQHMKKNLLRIKQTQSEWDTEYSHVYKQIKNDKSELNMFLDLEQKIMVLEEDMDSLRELEQEEKVQKQSNQLRDKIQERAKDFKNKRTELLHIDDELSQLENMRYAKQIKQDFDKHRFWSEWNRDSTRYDKIIAAFDYQQKLLHLNQVFDLLQDKESIYKEIEHLENTIPLVDEWFRGKTLSNQIRNMEEELSNLQLLFFMHLEKLKKKNEMSIDIRHMLDLQDNIQCNMGSIKNLKSKFSYYHDWTLKENIIPMITKYVNTLLLTVCKNHRPLELVCQTVYKCDELTMHWMVKDHDMVISLSKASGYQKCVINLMMRLILGKMGVTDMSNNQLFIDEGFTACDDDNLKIIPGFLQSLLHIYKSIVLVTHIDELKKHFRHQIPIYHNNKSGLSALRDIVPV